MSQQQAFLGIGSIPGNSNIEFIAGDSGGNVPPDATTHVFNLLGGTTGLTFAGSIPANSETLTGTLNVAHGGTGAVTLTGLLVGNGTSAFTPVTPANNGVLITSNVGAISWLPNSSTPGYVLTANSAAPASWQPAPYVPLVWLDEAVSFAAVASRGYFCTGTLTVSLPASPSQGDSIIIYVDSSSVVTVQANTGQTIQIGATQTSTAGTATSTSEGSTLTLVYRVSDTEWHSVSGEGSWTLA